MSSPDAFVTRELTRGSPLTDSDLASAAPRMVTATNHVPFTSEDAIQGFTEAGVGTPSPENNPWRTAWSENRP